MHNLVKSYLVHYAYVETLQAYEDEEMDTGEVETKDDLAKKEEVVENGEKNVLFKGLKVDSNVFPGLSQQQMK